MDILDRIDEGIKKFIEVTGARPKYLYLHPDTLEELQELLKEKTLGDFIHCTNYRGLLLKILVEIPVDVFYLTYKELPQSDIDTYEKGVV